MHSHAGAWERDIIYVILTDTVERTSVRYEPRPGIFQDSYRLKL